MLASLILFLLAACFASSTSASALRPPPVPAQAALTPSALAAFQTVAADGHRYQLDCTYAQRSAEGLALPAYNGAPAIIYVRSWICGTLNQTLARKWRGAETTGTAALAVLVLTHEAVHLSAFPGRTNEHETECRALALMPRMFAALHAPAALMPRLLDWAAQAHAKLLAQEPATY